MKEGVPFFLLQEKQVKSSNTTLRRCKLVRLQMPTSEVAHSLALLSAAGEALPSR